MNDVIVNQNDTIYLTNSIENAVYRIACFSPFSKPDVTLSIYDKETGSVLWNEQNSIVNSKCNFTTQLCENSLYVEFRFDNDTTFNFMETLTCSAQSEDPKADFVVTIDRKTNVTVTSQSNQINI